VHRSITAQYDCFTTMSSAYPHHDYLVQMLSMPDSLLLPMPAA
jgi:hypothetical protein